MYRFPLHPVAQFHQVSADICAIEAAGEELGVLEYDEYFALRIWLDRDTVKPSPAVRAVTVFEDDIPF